MGTKTADDCVRTNYTGGCIVARRSVRYVSHQRLELPIALDTSCIDVPCGATTTCVNGNCVPAMIDQCGPNGCMPDGGPPQPVVKTLGGPGSDLVIALARGTDGNLYMGGSFEGASSFGGPAVMPNGSVNA
jgi:hypothetical protein